MHTQNTTPHGAAYTRFVSQLPRMPRATDDFQRHGLYRYPQADALASRYIQPDRPYAAAWLKLDVDRIEACAAWIDAGLPRPHLMMGNPSNGRGHLLWGLAAPVVTSLNGRATPVQFLAEIEAGYTRVIGADPAYSGHTIKTPHHPAWYTHEHDAPLYSLSDLAHALPASVSRRRIPRAEYAGHSRTLTLFDTLRYWAYGEATAARAAGSYDRWADAVHAHAYALNGFDAPLTISEVRSIARSVARWTWKHAHTLSAAKIGGLKRSRVKSHNRPEMTPQEARDRMTLSAERTNAIRRNHTFDAITAAIAELAGEGVTNPSAAQIAGRAGVSSRTVFSFRRAHRGTGGGN